MNQYRLKPHQEWFLKYMMERHPLGLAGTHKRPPGMPPQVDMMVVRGFIKRGWMYEVPGVCLFYLSEEGLKVAQQLKMFHWLGNHPLAEKVVKEIHKDGSMTTMTSKEQRAWEKKNKTVIRDTTGEAK